MAILVRRVSILSDKRRRGKGRRGRRRGDGEACLQNTVEYEIRVSIKPPVGLIVCLEPGRGSERILE